MADPSSGSRPGSTSESALAHLRWVGFDLVESAVPIEGGWASWTYLVDEQLIARFPRTDEVAAAHARELRLLPELAAHVRFRVPEPYDVRGVLVYDLIPGAELATWGPAQAHAFNAAMHELHDVPVDVVSPLLGPQQRAGDARTKFESLSLPALSIDLADRVRRELDRPVRQTWTPRLVHGDLGPEHVLWHHETRIGGIIDFEDAHIGDPAVDFVLIDEWMGHTLRKELLAGHDLGDDVEERLWRYGWKAVLHGLAHAVETGDDDGIVAMGRDLRRRLDAGPPR